MKSNAIYLSVEAMISLLLLISLIMVQQQEAPGQELMQLHILQKENDLLKLWIATGAGEKEMASDFEFVFPMNAGRIEINGRVVFRKGTQLGRAIYSSAEFYDAELRKHEIKLGIFY